MTIEPEQSNNPGGVAGGSGAGSDVGRPGLVGSPVPPVSPGLPVPQGAWALIKRLGPVGPLALLAASMPAVGGIVLLGSMKWTGPYLEAHGAQGVALYITGFAVLAGLALLPTYAQAVLGGFAFGLYGGAAAALAGIAGASSIGYLIARRASGQRVVELIAEQPKWKAVYDELVGSGFKRTLMIVTLLRLPTNSPFAITNLVMACCRVHPAAYFVGTVVGIAPRTTIAAGIGAGLDKLDFSQPRQSWMIIAAIVSTLIVVIIIGVMANRAIMRLTQPAVGNPADPPTAHDR